MVIYTIYILTSGIRIVFDKIKGEEFKVMVYVYGLAVIGIFIVLQFIFRVLAIFYERNSPISPNKHCFILLSNGALFHIGEFVELSTVLDDHLPMIYLWAYRKVTFGGETVHYMDLTLEIKENKKSVFHEAKRLMKIYLPEGKALLDEERQKIKAVFLPFLKPATRSKTTNPKGNIQK